MEPEETLLEHGFKMLILFMGCAVAVLYVFLFFAYAIDAVSERDQQIIEGAKKYEACVQQEYGMSPAKYYQDTGHYPKCDYEQSR